MMNRRGLFQAIAGVAASGAITRAGVCPAGRIGCLTVDGHRAHRQLTGENLRVFLNGVEVHGVYEADDVEGYVLVFCQDGERHRDWTARGAKHLATDGGGACRMRLTGAVEFRP